VRVYVERGESYSGNATVTLRATSECDPTKTATQTCTVRPRDAG
jgi:hypothetical protein